MFITLSFTIIFHPTIDKIQLNHWERNDYLNFDKASLDKFL